MKYIESQNQRPKLRLGEEPTIDPSARILDSHFGRYVEISEAAEITETTIDDYSYVMEHCSIASCTIGKFVNIASRVRINPGNHPVDWVTQHHFMYRKEMFGLDNSDDQDFFDWRRRQRVIIGHDVWIGHNAVIMPGVSIGNGVAIGSGAIVTHDVEPYAIVAGVPARKIRLRFNKAICRAIEQTGWFHWKHDLLKKRLNDFKDIRLFLSKYGEKPA